MPKAVVLAGVVVACAGAVAVLVLRGDDREGGVAVGRVPGLVLPPNGVLFGFNDQVFSFTAGPQPQLDQGVTAEREAADALAAGANSARLTVAWSGIEPRPGRYVDDYVGVLKRFTDRIEAAGGRVLLTLGVPPRWARAAPGQATSAIRPEPALVEAFARYAAFVARTWPRAAAIEVWNEPNTTYFWRPRKPEPRLYAAMHRAAVRAIRATGSNVPVLLGGLLGVDRANENVMVPADFLEAARAAGLTSADYDGVAYHAYPVPADRRLPPLRRGVFARALGSFLAAARPPGGGRPPRLWITETGLTTTGDWAVSDADQARGLLDLVAYFAGRRDVAGVYLHTLYVPVEYPGSSIQRGFGILQARGARPGKPKPAYCALRAHARETLPVAGC